MIKRVQYGKMVECHTVKYIIRKIRKRYEHVVRRIELLILKKENPNKDNGILNIVLKNWALLMIGLIKLLKIKKVGALFVDASLMKKNHMLTIVTKLAVQEGYYALIAIQDWDIWKNGLKTISSLKPQNT